MSVATDPVAARPDPAKIIRDSMGLGGKGVEASGSFNTMTLGWAQRAIDDLAASGYVLVNADMLAEALESSEPDWFEGNGDDWAMQSAEVAAAAIFAALTRSAQKEGPAR